MKFLLMFPLMFYGFQWYGGALQGWKTMLIVPRIATLLLLGVFGSVDIVWNLIFGTLTFWERPFKRTIGGTRWYHRQWTFSLRVEHWYNAKPCWRRDYLLGADNWRSLLNSMVAGHIVEC
jgi:hypothetical protein